MNERSRRPADDPTGLALAGTGKEFPWIEEQALLDKGMVISIGAERSHSGPARPVRLVIARFAAADRGIEV